MTPLHWSVKVLTPPTVEAIDLSAMKLYLRTDNNEEDETIADLIASARDYIEGQTGVAMMTTQYKMMLDRFPLTPGLEFYSGVPAIPVPAVDNRWPMDPAAWAIQLPRSPLATVDALKYIDTDGTLQTLSADSYTVDTNSDPGRVSPASGVTWPAVLFGPQAVQITFTAGSTSQDLVPPQLRQALRMLVGHYYENREVLGEGRFAELPMAVKSILDNCRASWF